MKRIQAALAAAVLVAQANAWASPAESLAFRPAENGAQARKVSADCTGTPTRMCVCYRLDCRRGQRGSSALPPAPPPPPPPPPAPALPPAASVEMPAGAYHPPVHLRQAAPKLKRFRFVFAADMLPFQFDFAVGRHLALSVSFAAFVAGENPSYYLGGFLGLHYFPKGPAPKGFRLSVQGGRLVWGKKAITDENGSLNVLRLAAGYNWVWSNGFTIGLGFGKQLIHRTRKNDRKPLTLLIPHMEFNMGVAF